MLIDTHAHVFLKQFDEDRNEVIERAIESGVEKILLPNIDSTTINEMISLEKQFPANCHSMIGLHPCSVKEDYKKELDLIEEWLEKRPFIAIGEIGTDLHWDKTFWEQQKMAFVHQCELAIVHDLPIVVHCRESIDETIELVSPYKNKGLKGVFHCFTGSLEQASQLVDLGFYLGIGGVATFKNGGLREKLAELDINRLVLETDSPYLTPTPHRGKRNEPQYVELVNKTVAESFGMSEKDVADITTANAKKLFSLT